MQPARLWCFALFVSLAASVAHGAEIISIRGTFSEQVLSIKAQAGEFLLKTPQRTLPLGSIKSIRFRKMLRRPLNEAGSCLLLLNNGDTLQAILQAGDEEALRIASSSLGAFSIPLEQIRAILPQPDPSRTRSLLGRLKAEEEMDWVLLRKGGTARGSVVEVDGLRVVLDTRREEVGPEGSGIGVPRFELDKVELVSVAPLNDPAPPSQALRVAIQLRDSSLVSGELLELQEATLRLKHPLAQKKGLEIPLKEISELSVENGRFVYLSSLDPIETDQRFPPEYAYEVDVWGYKRDRNVLGETLRLKGRSYARGLGVHSYCALSYALQGQYREFRSLVGLDDSIRYLGEPGFGGVVFKVLLDGKPAREYPSGVAVSKGDAPRELVVNIAQKQTLTLVADFDPVSLHVLGRANWADAHLIKVDPKPSEGR